MPFTPPLLEKVTSHLSLGFLEKEMFGDDAESTLPFASAVNEMLTNENTSNESRILLSLVCHLVKQNTYLYSKVLQVEQTTDDLSSNLLAVQLKVNSTDSAQNMLQAQVASAFARSLQQEKPKEKGKAPNPPQAHRPPPKTTNLTEDSQLTEYEIIDDHGNRRPMTYAEKAKIFGPPPLSAFAPVPRNKATPPPKTKNPRTPSSSAPTTPLSQSQRRIYITRSFPAPVENKIQVEATLPAQFGKILADGGLSYPDTRVAISINPRGTVTCTASPTTPNSKLQPFFPRFVELLNIACRTNDNPYTEFKLASTDVDFIIHSIPIFAFESDDMLTPTIRQNVKFACDINVLKARFLTKPENRLGKKATSVVISVSKEDASKVGSHMTLFGQPRKCDKVWHASPNTICSNCSKLGHASQGCRQKAPTCPICAGAHLKKDHRCPNLACPKGGNQKTTVDCCPSYNPKCTNCGGNHTAYDPKCPARPQKAPTDTLTPPISGLTTSFHAPHIAPEAPAGAMEGVTSNII